MRKIFKKKKKKTKQWKAQVSNKKKKPLNSHQDHGYQFQGGALDHEAEKQHLTVQQSWHQHHCSHRLKIVDIIRCLLSYTAEAKH